MIPGISLVAFIRAVSLIGVAAVIFAESGLLIGFFLPGDSLLFATGVLVHSNILPYNIHLVILVLWLAAAAGDSTGYAFGRQMGPRLFNRPNSRLFKQENVRHAERFYQKHGGKTVIIARFIPIVRTFVPVIAGVSNMHYRTFLFFNVIGAFLWTAVVTYAGYYLGVWFEKMGLGIDQVILPVILLILFLSILPPLIHILRNPKNRRAIIATAKKQLRFLTGKK